jgi:integrase
MRPRKRTNRTLPPNLYMSKSGKKYYFRYRNPQTGKETGIGSDRQAAILAANTLNAKLMPSAPDLVVLVMGGGDRMDTWMERYQELLEKRGLSASTMKSYSKLTKAIKQELGKVDLVDIDTRQVAQFLESYEATPTMARQLRSRLKDVFDEAIREGKVKHNPVTATRNPKVTVARSRLSLAQFNTVLESSEGKHAWIANSMLLALITGQRLEDISNMNFSDEKDGYLHIKQHKSGSLVRLSTGLRLDAIGMTVGEVVSRCRDRVVSRWLVHHVKNSCRAKAGGTVNKATISKAFKNARNLSGITGDNPPSFHEIRSLSGRLYKEQGIDAQSLLGHKSAATTALYVDVRGSEWISVG